MPHVSLLNPDGRVSPATAILLSHRAFRRDFARFRNAFVRGSPEPRALLDAWKAFEEHLHGHHLAEDTGIFPGTRTQHPAMAAALDRLSADHQKLDGLIASVGSALTTGKGLVEAMDALGTLLLPHLELEDNSFIAELRKDPLQPFDLPESEHAPIIDGIPWAAEGVEPWIVRDAFAMFPAAILAGVDASAARYAKRIEQLWGKLEAPTGRTAGPDA